MAENTSKNNILNTPILETEKLFYLNRGNKQKTLDVYDKELKKREIALYESYGLKRPDILDAHTRTLIKNMARELNIRGFYQTNEVKEPGAPKKWKSYDGALLWARVELEKMKNKNIPLRNVIANVIKANPNDYKLKTRMSAKIIKSTKNEDTLILDTIYKRYNDILTSPPWQIQIIPALKQMCNNERIKIAKKLGLDQPTEISDKEFLKDFFIPFCKNGE